MNDQFPKLEMEPKPTRLIGLFVIIGVILIAVVAYFFIAGRAPADFTPGTVVVIPDHSSVKEVGALLENDHIVRSAVMFDFTVKVLLGNRTLVAGEFEFDNPKNVFRVAEIITGGIFGKAQVRVTIPEGSSSMEIGTIIAKQIPGWDIADFDAKAKPFEGYLFPDTYFVFKSITSDDMIAKLKDEYQKKITPIQPEIQASGKSESDIIIMASILEKEAKNVADAKVIAGILWKRLAIHTSLQVDAPLVYALGKPESQLTIKDLKTDGPYNTFTRKGLPVGPISNPGIAMIEAAIHSVSSNDWYYLYGSDGQIHYATTYAQHMANRRMYLK